MSTRSLVDLRQTNLDLAVSYRMMNNILHMFVLFTAKLYFK